MLLSVIIPVYNNHLALINCLRSFSLADKLLRDTEFVIVDDGSDPPVNNYLSDIHSLNNPNLQIIRTPHNGAAAARNTGIIHARADFVWFFDADDCVNPSHFERMTVLLKNSPEHLDILHTGAMLSNGSAATNPSNEGCKETNESQLIRISLQELFVPKTAYLDHTTYIFKRSLLANNSHLRYPAHLILEDSLFLLLVLDNSHSLFCDNSLHPYIRNNFSSTAGAWSDAKSALLIPDICFFFNSFNTFLLEHNEITRGDHCYRRLRYVYMRVLCVKGCPWSLIQDFRSASFHNRPYKTLKEKILFYKPFGRVLAFTCRLLRKK